MSPSLPSLPRSLVVSAGIALLVALGACSGERGTSGLDGAPGAEALVNLVPEPAGARCANGGLAVQTGADENANGQLDPAEVDPSKTQYVCDGSDGKDGTSTPATLNRVASEPAGVTCAEGGLRIEAGVDDDQDGVLDDGEVDAALTRYVCQASLSDRIHFGDLVISSPDQLSLLDGVEVVIGSLYLEGDFGPSLSLPSLAVVTEDLGIDDTEEALAPSGGVSGPYEVSFPALTQAGYLAIYSTRITGLSAPALQEVDVVDLESTALTTVALPALAKVDDVYLYLTPLTSLSLPAVTRVGLVDLEENAGLQSFSAPLLTSTTLNLVDDPSLATLDLPALQTFGQGSQATGDMAALDACTVGALNLQAYSGGSRALLELSGGDDSACDPSLLCPFVPVGADAQTYRQCVMQQPFDGARAICQGLGGELVVFDDLTERDAVASAFVTGGFMNESFIGYADSAEEGTWAWVTGVTGYVPGTFWNSGEPNDGAGGEDCAELGYSGLANDVSCAARKPFLCELPPAP